MAHEKFPGGASEGPLDRFDLPLLSIQPQDAIRCLRAGKHVLAGKPPALTKNDLDRGLEAASESGKSFREMGPSAFVQPRDIVFGGQIGEVVQIFSQKSYPDHDGRPPDGNIDGGEVLLQVGIPAARWIEPVSGQSLSSLQAIETQVGNPGSGALRMVVSLQGHLKNGAGAPPIANYLTQRGLRQWGNDEVRLYNRVLSLAEIQDLAEAAPGNVAPKTSLTNTAVSGTAGQPVTLGASVTDDGGPSALAVGWAKASGTGSVVFSNPLSTSTGATADAAGNYGLRITASDGSITTFADVAASFAVGGGIASWRQLHFGTTGNTGNAADDAIFSGDGLPNLLKYVMGLDPAVHYPGGSPVSLVQTTGVSGHDYLTLKFTRDTAVTDASIVVEATGDLNAGPWEEIDPLLPANQVEFLGDTPAAGLQTITVKDTQPIDPPQKRFMRFRVSRP